MLTSSAILFILWGLLTTLVGLSTLALGVGAFALMSSGASDGGGSSPPASSPPLSPRWL